MRNQIKRLFKVIIAHAVGLIGKTNFGGYVFEQVLNIAMKANQLVKHGQTQLLFAVPNQLNRYRAESFSTKEPETLEWLDCLPLNSVLWDIGANVGLYSCYAAKVRNCQVFAFEPSVFNLELLARNIYLNGLTDKIAIIPLPLSDHQAFSTLNMTSMEWGGALSTFGQDYGWDGLKMQKVFQFQTLGLSVDDASQLLCIPQPNYVKIDVDGIEHLILKGGETVLKKVDGVLIEINDDFLAQVEQSNKILLDAGLVLKTKCHSEMFDTPDSFGRGKVWNQIWHRECR